MGLFFYNNKIKKQTKLGHIYLSDPILVNPVDAPFVALQNGNPEWVSATPLSRMALSDNVTGDLFNAAKFDRIKVIASVSYSITADAPTEYDFGIAVGGTISTGSIMHSAQESINVIKTVSMMYESATFEPFYTWFQIRISRTAGIGTVVKIHSASLSGWSD